MSAKHKYLATAFIHVKLEVIASSMEEAEREIVNFLRPTVHPTRRVVITDDWVTADCYAAEIPKEAP